MITDGEKPEQWRVGIITEDAAAEILTEESGVNPRDIDAVVFPLSIPWADEPPLYNVALSAVEKNERSSGVETCHSARVEDTVPNSKDIWAVELEIWDYPKNVFNMSRLTHTDQVGIASWDSSDLLDAIKNRFL